MKVIPFVYNSHDDVIANTYVLIDSNSCCAVIDPSVDYDGIISYIEKEGLTLQFVLITHGHFDHIRGLDRLIEHFKVPAYISFIDVECLKDPYLNCSKNFSQGPVVIKTNCKEITEGDHIKGLDEDVEVILTPYHTAGSCCYYLKNSKLLFSGDSLFKRIIGRDDLPTSIPSKRKESLNKLIKLPDDVIVYPGHGSNTTIGYEKKSNPFINR